jgi:hypothetical protein
MENKTTDEHERKKKKVRELLTFSPSHPLTFCFCRSSLFQPQEGDATLLEIDPVEATTLADKKGMAQQV